LLLGAIDKKQSGIAARLYPRVIAMIAWNEVGNDYSNSYMMSDI
jgi:hypothetical protein